MFNKPTSEAALLNKSSCLVRALGVTKFINMRYVILVTLFVILKSDLDVQQTHIRWRHSWYTTHRDRCITWRKISMEENPSRPEIGKIGWLRVTPGDKIYIKATNSLFIYCLVFTLLTFKDNNNRWSHLNVWKDYLSKGQNIIDTYAGKQLS